ncbi:methyltransferase domain-containing protein [Dongia soli]|uniref:Class I SAM-dependent methyltransferase n=1 Tax=Dongia soli TaxID=600628 RepID=A0ABU5ECG4_9PROT|nr:class I SAM-dependent methyltransferase [Dongia soli]MDY0884068.1 class I SAM-dependent methyltransferase [Dongia soli]
MANLLDSFIPAYRPEFPYALDNEIMLSWYPNRILELHQNRGSLLEFGLGHGYTTKIFSEHFARHLVIDGSGSVIRQFREQYPDCKADIQEALFETFQTTEKFDVIVMGFILEHVDSPQRILGHAKQFLRPGGRCFIAVPNGESLHRRIGKAAGLLDDMMKLGAGDIALGHQRQYSREVLQQELTSAGYRTVHCEGIFLKPLTTSQLTTLQLNKEILTALCTVGINYPELCCGLLVEAEIRWRP